MARFINIAICIICLYPYSLLAQNSKQEAIDMNNKLSQMVATLYENGSKWGETYIKIDSTTRRYSELAPLRVKMEQFLDDKLVELNAMQDVSGSHDFRMALIHFMQVEKNMLNSAFKGIEKLNPKSTPAQKQNAITNLTNESKKEDVELKKIRKIQDAYARQNGFSITD